MLGGLARQFFGHKLVMLLLAFDHPAAQKEHGKEDKDADHKQHQQGPMKSGRRIKIQPYSGAHNLARHVNWHTRVC